MAETRRKKQPTGLHGRAEEISEILKLLGNPQRLLIACLLCEGEYAVSEIEEKLRHSPADAFPAARRAARGRGDRRAPGSQGRHLSSGRCAHAPSPRRAASHLLSRRTGCAGCADVAAAARRFVGGRCVLRSCRPTRRPLTVEDVMAVAKGSNPSPSHRFPNRSVPVRPPHADPRDRSCCSAPASSEQANARTPISVEFQPREKCVYNR